MTSGGEERKFKICRNALREVEGQPKEESDPRHHSFSEKAPFSLYISCFFCYNVPIYGDEEEEYVRQSEPAVVRGRRWTEGVSELFPEQSREIREIKVGLKGTLIKSDSVIESVFPQVNEGGTAG